MKNVLEYYYCSLADGERMEPNAQEVLNKSIEIKNIQNLSFEKVQDSLAKNKSEDETRYEIIATPFRITKSARSGMKPSKQDIFPYWLPFVISKEDGLQPPDDQERTPWLTRGVLVPNEYSNENYPTLGHVQKVDEVILTYNWDHNDINQYLDQANHFFKKINGKNWKEIELDHWVISAENWFVLEADVVGFSNNIFNLYDYLLKLEVKNFPKLLKNVLNTTPFRPKLIKDIDLEFTGIDHKGQMSGEYPLAKSQRASMLGFSQLDISDILAVNGPPGTGKTTLLQSAFGHRIVKNTLNFEKDSEPTRILASSTNNQAITNILESCEKIPMAPGLSERWLPELSSFGTYLISSSPDKEKQVKKKNYLAISKLNQKGKPPFKGWYYDYINTHSSEECMEYFQNRFQKHFNCQLTSAGKMQSRLMNELAARQKKIEKYLQTINSIKNFAKGSEPVQAIKIGIKKLENEKKENEKKILTNENALSHVQDYLIKEAFWKKALSFLPFIMNARIESVEALLSQFSLFEDLQIKPLGTLLNRLKSIIDIQKEKIRSINQKIKEQEKILEDYNQILSAWEKLKAKRKGSEQFLEEIWDAATLGERINILCDLELRHESFWLSVHSWELKWIQERNDENFLKLGRGIQSIKKFYTTLAYLTPFFVSTFHSAPRFCAVWNKNPSGDGFFPSYSTDFFDLLVVDEGGQVSPEVAIPTFSLAKEALVVGDVKQIEPVWNMTNERIDKSNMERLGVIKDKKDYRQLKRRGLTCVSGSILKIAQNRSLFHYPEECDEKGAMLQEHRRCVDEIIAFSNKEIYKGLLIPKIGSLERIKEKKRGKSEPFLDLPALGYLNAPGESRRYNGSRRNKNEAQAIALWVLQYKERLLKAYQKLSGNGLEKIIGIITPFRAQKNLILKCLKENDIEDNLTVGTVHALQGAERPVILFSSVYGRNDQTGSFFYDAGFNMLNVALSRAKEHFFVIGTMKNFDTGADTPSGKLGKMLFSAKENELESNFLYEKNIFVKNSEIKVNRIRDLDMHQRSLAKAINQANKRLIIVSPFISNHAIEADNLIPLFENAKNRGVEILIYTDAFLDRPKNNLKPHAQRGRELLNSCGLDVIEKNGIHNKSLAIDNEVLIEGSFNWLSAVRDINSPYHRHETSLVIKGKHAKEGITQLIEDLEILN